MSRLRNSTRPLNAAIRVMSAVATSGSFVATLVTSDPPPRSTSAAASSRVRYARTLATGPKASISWTAGAAASVNPTRIGSRNAPSPAGPVDPSACTTSGASVEPSSRRPPAASRARTLATTSSRCSRETRGPIVTASACGSPITTRSATLSRTASTRASTDAAGTIARRMAVHFCPAFVVSSTMSCRTYASNSGVPGTASGPSTEALIESVSLVKRTPGAASTCRRAAVDALPVKLTVSPRPRCSKSPGTLPLTSCSEPSGRLPGLDEDAHPCLGEIRRGGRGLHQARHARQERRRELLEGAPHREVEGVDLHGDAGQSRVDVAAEERAVLRQRLDRPVEVDGGVRQLAPPLRRVGEEHADAAVDVAEGVALRGAGALGQVVELLLAVGQRQRELLEQHGPLVEGQGAEGCLARRARVLQGTVEIRPVGADPDDRLAGRRIAHQGTARLAEALGHPPLALQIARQHSGHLPLPAQLHT